MVRRLFPILKMFKFNCVQLRINWAYKKNGSWSEPYPHKMESRNLETLDLSIASISHKLYVKLDLSLNSKFSVI